MQRNHKLAGVAGALAAALALGSSPAQAVIDGTTATGGSEWVFAAWGMDAEGKGVGYVYDLDTALTLESFIGADVATSSTPGTALPPSLTKPYFQGALPQFASFQALLANPMDFVWNLAAAESFGRSRVVSTVELQPAVTPTNGAVRKFADNFGVFSAAAATKGTHPQVADGVAFDLREADLTAYPGPSASSAYGQNFGGASSGLDNAAGPGVQLPLVMFWQKSLLSSQANGAGGFGALSQDGLPVVARMDFGAQGAAQLTVTAVPEPTESALWLAGLGLLGLIARRRLNG